MQLTMTNNFHNVSTTVFAHKTIQGSSIAVVTVDQLNQAFDILCPKGPSGCDCSEYSRTGISENGQEFKLISPLEFHWNRYAIWS